MTEPAASTGVQQKALQLNLDESIFGSFAEIGAGQEVARWFMRVGAASGTVAKTISAYDKAVSDDLYGAGTRYVSRPRLHAMIDAEWGSLLRQVGDERRRDAKLFAFANTASARNYAGTNLCHAWVGVRFRPTAESDASDVIVHANLRDSTNLGQQEALGILGVNLVHAVFHARDNADALITAIAEGVAPERIGIDLLEATGPCFEGWDTTRMQATLAHAGLSAGCVILRDDTTETPAEAFYKRSMVVLPGRFEAIEEGQAAAAELACNALVGESEDGGRPPAPLFALSVENGHTLDETLDRSRRLRALGAQTAVFERRELYHMTQALECFTSGPIRFAVSIGVLVRVLEETQYDRLSGQLLEAISRLFEQDVRLYVFPAHESSLDQAIRSLVRAGDGPWITPDRIRPTGAAAHLYDYLMTAGFIVPLDSPSIASA